MRRLGRPEYGMAIVREMNRNATDPDDDNPPFERLVFGKKGSDVTLPPESSGHEFRVYRAGDLILVRNSGSAPLWIRGKSLETGSFLRMRERQPLVLPGWTLSYEDLVFFLDVNFQLHLSAADSAETILDVL